MNTLCRTVARWAALPLLSCWAVDVRGDDWPQWRGPNRNGVSAEQGLLKSWPEGGPKVAWTVSNAGVAYSSLAVKDGRVITQGDLDGIEHIICYSEKDGKLLWAVQPEPVAKVLAERVKKVFDQHDKNGDGQLDEIEALNAFGGGAAQMDVAGEGDRAEIAKARVEKLLKALDKDADGKLAFSEVPGGMQGNFDKIDADGKPEDAMELATARAKGIVAAADKDGDEKLSRQETRGTIVDRLFNAIDEKHPDTKKGDDQLTIGEIRTYFFAKEPGRDGVLTKAELQEYFQKQQGGKDGVLTAAEINRNEGGYRNSYGDGPRGTPTIDGDRVYVEGGKGDVTCLEAATGKTIWHVNLRDLGGGTPGWGYSESPLIVDDLVIVTPGGGKGTLAALKKSTGEVVWRSTDVKQGAHYASPQVATIAGVRQIVQFSSQSVYGVSMEGKPLWSYSGANNGTANIATPIIFGDNVLAASGYGKGAGLVKVSGGGDSQKADEVYFQGKLANHHGGIVKVDDYVYGFGGAWVCMNFGSGEIAWQARGVGKGSLVYADGMFYALSENHEVGLFEASPGEYRETGRFKIKSHGKPAWAHPVVANGRLYIRNLHDLTAYDIKAGN